MSVSVKDNRTFFYGIYQEVWRKMIPPALTPAEADFIEDVCGFKKDLPLLDLMCGYGRHALELARRGYPVTAVDSSEDYIREVTAEASAAALPVTAVVADAAAYAFQGSYGAAICMGNSFSFFDEASLQQLLGGLQQAITPGGCFVINTWMIAEIVFRHFAEREWHQVAEYKYLIESRYLTQPSRVEAGHTILLPDGTIECLQAVDYIYSLAELERLLAQYGFCLQDVFYTPRKRKFQLGDNKAYIVAVRK